MRYFVGMSADQARKQLMKLLAAREPLRQELLESGFDFGSKRKYFTNKEVEIIVRHLGKPT
ncbi:MAG: DUF4248 domain-containing protein [Bacteroidales bacterium]|nr:DUF4248 domain-containing protein [Bacteroidales bacterium]